MARDLDIHIEWDGIPHAMACLDRLRERADAHLDQEAGEAAEEVATRTRMAIPLGPVAGGHAKSSVRVERGHIEATVHEGGPAFPYLPWLEFGGRVGRKHANHRQWIEGGRYMYRALSMIKPGIEPSMHDGMREAARESGWNPDG
jgi:hypothetical protein